MNVVMAGFVFGLPLAAAAAESRRHFRSVASGESPLNS